MIFDNVGDEKALELHCLTEADRFVWVKFKPEMLLRRNIPDTAYPLRTSTMEDLLISNGVVQIADIVRGLMDWLDFTDNPRSACVTLRRIIDSHFPRSLEKRASCEFEIDRYTRSRFRLDLNDVKSPLVKWHRKGWVTAIGCTSKIEPGLLNIAVPHLLTLKTVQSILDNTHIIVRGRPFNSVAPLRSTVDRIYRSEGAIMLSSWENKLNDSTRIDQDVGASTFSLPPSDKWLVPNQIAVLMAIGSGYL